MTVGSLLPLLSVLLASIPTQATTPPPPRAACIKTPRALPQLIMYGSKKVWKRSVEIGDAPARGDSPAQSTALLPRGCGSAL